MISEQQKAAIAAKLENMELAVGIGDETSACSIAAINLALSGKVTDRIPDCMSAVLGRWVIVIQDTMPSDLRNSAGWKSLLPLAAGTGRSHEKKRLSIVMDWMWGTVLPALQQAAESGGYGDEWSRMTQERTYDAAYAAKKAAWAAADAADAAADAAAEADAAAYAAAYAAYAADAGRAARAAAYAAGAADGEDAAWQVFDPVSLLRQLINVGGGE
jgi:hypothetical protein